MLLLYIGRAVAQMISSRISTAATRGQAPVKWLGICGGQNGTGAVFFKVLRFPLLLIHSTNCSTIITIYHPGLVQ
jgi:hypothetical protein